MIFDGMSERSPDQSKRYGLDLHSHRGKRNKNWANTFFHHEDMLDWLGVTIYVSRPKSKNHPIVAPKDPLGDFSSTNEQISQVSQVNEQVSQVSQVNEQVSQVNEQISQVEQSGKVKIETISIERSLINRWLTDKRRLRKGRFSSEFAKLLLWLAKMPKDDPRICVSVCGSHAVAAAAQTCINAAKKQGLKVEVEFVSESQ